MYASFFGALGCACSIVFTTFGAAYGTAKSAGAIFQSGILRPDMMMQNTLCAIMAQILSIYGLVASVIMSNNIKEKMAIHTAFLQLGAGISVGLCGMAAGFAIGIVGDAGGMFIHGLKAANLTNCDKCLTIPSSCKFAATASLYRNGSHPHLCRGSRLIRCHCVHPYVNSFHRWCDRMQVLRHTNQTAIARYHVRP